MCPRKSLSKFLPTAIGLLFLVLSFLINILVLASSTRVWPCKIEFLLPNPILLLIGIIVVLILFHCPPPLY